MKKLLLLLIMLTFTLGLSAQKASADDSIVTTIEWALNTTYNPRAIETSVEFGDGAKEVSIIIPVSEFHTHDNGAYIFDLDFRDESDNLLKHIQLQDAYGFEIGSEDSYVFNFAGFGVVGCTKIEITLPQTFSGDAPEGYMAYINDNTSVTVDYGLTPYGLFDFIRTYSGDTSANTYMTQKIDIPSEVEYLTLASSFRFTLRLGDLNEELYFYDENGVLLVTLPFNLIAISNRQDDLTADILQVLYVYMPDLVDYEDIESFAVRRLSTQGNVSIADMLATTSFYDFDGDGIFDANYISEGEIHESFKTVAGAILSPRELDPDPADPLKQFSYWAMADGSEYRDTVLTSNDFTDGVYTLYAIFETIPDPVVTVIDNDPTDGADVFIVGIDDLGGADPVSRTIIFAILIILVSVGLLYKGVNNFVIILVNSAITGFFIYLGILPIFVTVVLILLLIFLAFSLRAGGRSNE